MTLREMLAAGRFPAYTQHEIDDTATFCHNHAVRMVPLENGDYQLTVGNDGSYGLFKQDVFVGYANVVPETFGSTSYGSLKLIYLVPEARKTKAFLIFVNALRHIVGKPIVVDGAVFDDGAAALNAMAKRNLFTVKILDKLTNCVAPFLGIVPTEHSKAIIVEGIDFPLGDYYPLPGMSPTDPSCYRSFLWFG